MPDLDVIFKAYDVRGIFPQELDETTAEKIGKATVRFLKCKTIVVGRDMRESGEKIFKALSAGINSQGAYVVDIGLCSTDLFYFSVWKLKADAGIMITASHNPKEYNGLKIVRKNAQPVGEDTGLMEIKALVEKNSFKISKKGGKIKRKNLLKEFKKFCLGFVDAKKIKPLKVVMDAGNGMASIVAPEIFQGLPIKQIRQCFTLDGNFPNHEANPLKPENRKDSEERVKREHADLALMWDGDADRCFFVNEKGEYVSADLVVALLAKNMLKKKKHGKVLYDLRCSHYVPETIKKAGGIPIIYRVGHAFMKKKMKDEEAIFAGELSGHNYYAKGDLYFDNGFIPALQIMELISEENKTLSELLSDAEGYYHSGEINSEVQDKDAKIREIDERYKAVAKKTFYVDGISMEFSHYWFNVRKSNTEPLLRLNLEADSKELMEEKVKELLEIIRKK